MDIEEIIQSSAFQNLVKLTLEEDLRVDGDVTSRLLIDEDQVVHATLLSRGDYVFVGAPVATYVFHQLDPSIQITNVESEGAPVHTNQQLFSVQGQARAILTAERTVLNFLQHLTGVATITSLFVQKAMPHGG